jgi:hypothetical protein
MGWAYFRGPLMLVPLGTAKSSTSGSWFDRDHVACRGIKMIRIWILAALLSTAANAAEITVVRLSGVIAQGDEFKFVYLTSHLSKAVVRLDSVGGFIYLAMAIGRSIRDRHWDTEVYYDYESACGLIWSGGQQRFLPPGTRLGFHQPKDNAGVSQERPPYQGLRSVHPLRRIAAMAKRLWL